MQEAIDINSDVGESFGNYSFGADNDIMPHLSSANVACGFHAGDPVHMENTVSLAKQHGVTVGVHWGLPDIAGFGRRQMDISPDEARCLTLYQIGALQAIVASVGATIDHLVPHGALYAMLASNEAVAGAMIDAIKKVNPTWVLYWPTPLERHRFYEIAQSEGMPIAQELCIDLDYRGDGSIVIERLKKPIDPSYAADRVQRFLEDGKLRTIDDTDLEFEAQALLLHGDGPNAVGIVQGVRTMLERMQVAVRPAASLV